MDHSVNIVVRRPIWWAHRRINVVHSLRVIRVREVSYFSPSSLNGGRRECLICSKDSALCSLPPNLSYEARADFEAFSSRVGAIRVRQSEDQRGDEFRLNMCRLSAM